MRERIESRRGGQAFDFIAEIAAPIAMQLIVETLGVPGFEPGLYMQYSTDLTRGMDSGVDPSRIEAARSAGRRVRGDVATWFSAAPEGGMMLHLSENEVVKAEAAGKSETYIANTLGGVFNAGFSTTVAATGSALQLLHERPDERARLREVDDLVSASHELLRFMSPAQATARYAVVETEIAGQKILPGQTIVTLLASANRDETVFDEPEALIFDRNPNPHLAFAWGPHVCLGAQLAVGWMTEFIPLLIDMADSLEVVSAPHYLDSATLRTIHSIEVAVH